MGINLLEAGINSYYTKPHILLSLNTSTFDVYVKGSLWNALALLDFR